MDRIPNFADLFRDLDSDKNNVDYASRLADLLKASQSFESKVNDAKKNKSESTKSSDLDNDAFNSFMDSIKAAFADTENILDKDASCNHDNTDDFLNSFLEGMKEGIEEVANSINKPTDEKCNKQESHNNESEKPSLIADILKRHFENDVNANIDREIDAMITLGEFDANNVKYCSGENMIITKHCFQYINICNNKDVAAKFIERAKERLGFSDIYFGNCADYNECIEVKCCF